MQQSQFHPIRQRVKNLLPKLKCAFHQNQTLTNFCSCPKCLLPLCPTCIKIHTIQHVNMKTDPQYENLFDMVLQLMAEVKQFISIGQENHRLITEKQHKLNQFKDQIFTNIDNIKKSMIDLIEKYFTELIITTQQKINQMPYIQDLAHNKSELKKTMLTLKKFQKQLNDENVTGKFVVRNLIKYSAKGTSDMLQKYDTQCKEFLSKVEERFYDFQMTNNLNNKLISFLGQGIKIHINEIPSLKTNEKQEMFSIAEKLQQFTYEGKGSQKSQIKNALTKVMSKLSHPNNKNTTTSTNKFQGLSQTTQKPNIEDFDKKDKKRESKSDLSQVSRNIFDFNKKRTISNHSSQRKSLHISRSFCENQNSTFDVKQKENQYFATQNSLHERKSLSKGKGLSLIQGRNSLGQNESRSLTNTQKIRFSLAEIQNVNFDIDYIKSGLQFTPQNLRSR